MDIHLKIKLWLYFFITGLILVGISTFPLQQELNWLNQYFGVESSVAEALPALSQWISKVHIGFTHTNHHYPFMTYGLDWLGFAHIILGVLFIGPLRDPVRNVWVIEFGMIACLLVIPFALIFGHFRDIPFFSRLIDCSFGVVGIIPLIVVRRYIKIVESGQLQ